MAIYTKTGDRGETGVFGGARVSKSDPIIIANGELDELTSTLGWARVGLGDSTHANLLERVQRDLYTMMGWIAGYGSPSEDIEVRIALFEETIDVETVKLPELHVFVIPGTSEASARLHVARAVCRRSERALVTLLRVIDESSAHAAHAPLIIRYLNRLSDLLFTLARAHTPHETTTK